MNIGRNPKQLTNLGGFDTEEKLLYFGEIHQLLNNNNRSMISKEANAFKKQELPTHLLWSFFTKDNNSAIHIV